MTKRIYRGARHMAIVFAVLMLGFAFAGASGVSLNNSSAAAGLEPQGTPTPSPTASPTPNFEHCQISLNSPTFTVGEGGGQVVIGVNRTCDRVRDSKVDFFTQSRSASAGADFTPAFGRIDFADGETNKTITVPIADDAIAEGNESFNLFLTDPGGSAMLIAPMSALITIIDNDGTPGATPTPSPTPTASPTPRPTPDDEHCQISLDASTYSVAEGAGHLAVRVNRVCDRERDSKVDFFTRNGTASDRSDFTFAAGRVFFAPGETSKTINLLITDDALVEGNENFNLFLTDPGGSSSLSFPNSAVVTIVDNDTAAATSNPIENSDFFVQQHYADFLNRRADDSGLDYWRGRINECGANEDCIRDRRVGVSAAFFIEQEFQDTGNFVYRMYQATFGRKPMYAEFMPDRGRVSGNDLAASKAAFSDDWVTRPEFTQMYPANMSSFEYVNRVMDRAGLFGHEVERERLEREMESGMTRSQVLRDVIEMQDFKDREYNKAFVLMEYFGYLRRDPDANGYDFWVNVLNQGTRDNYRGMVCAFITSGEMQNRFSSIRTRTDAECGR